jgi:hypothetical protein
MSEDAEPKFHIDEDWKAKVKREREAARQAESPEASSGDPEPASEPTHHEIPRGGADGGAKLPPASMSMMIQMFATQAYAVLGLFPDPETGKPSPPDLDAARHLIDLLGVLEEKTKGNLTTEEQNLLRGSLYQLRMTFVEVSKQPR